MEAIMGGFINSQADNEICEVLNKRFSDEVKPNDPQRRTYIALLRDHFQRENLFDANHHLHRVFHRLAVNVTGGARVPRHNQSRFRWLFLLRSNLPAAVRQAIKAQLTAILSPVTAGNPAGAVDYATFATRHVPTATGTFELWPRNSTVPTIQTDANRKRYCTIILECHDDVALPDSPNETDPPDPDNGETTFAAGRSPAKKSAKKAAKKSSAKKSAVKKSSGKKTASKKRKARK
jgi:hypothetical protein